MASHCVAAFRSRCLRIFLRCRRTARRKSFFRKLKRKCIKSRRVHNVSNLLYFIILLNSYLNTIFNVVKHTNQYVELLRSGRGSRPPNPQPRLGAGLAASCACASAGSSAPARWKTPRSPRAASSPRITCKFEILSSSGLGRLGRIFS